MKVLRTTTVVVDASGRARFLKDQRLELKVTGGPDRRRTETLKAPRIVIGSAEAAHFRLADPTVSALHCELIADLEGTIVRDLDSRNGVLLRERRVKEAWLEDGDSLRLGHSVVKISAGSGFDERELGATGAFHGFRGSSLAMRQLYALLAKAGASSAPVLIRGETGTGKELAAEALVASSPRAAAELCVLDCSTLSSGLAEAHLFGHVEGAYTDARGSVAGVFERAHGGTVFLDEVGELPLELQAKLLGVLERKTVQRLGSPTPVPVDVRIIAATHRPLEAMVNAGTFRADLYFRLAAITLFLPPLRDHREDIPALVSHFLSELEGEQRLPPGELERLSHGAFPGNVRELRNAVARAALGFAAESPVPAEQAAAAAPPWDLQAAYRPQKERALAQWERGYLLALLDDCKGNVSEAARRSGLNRVHLYELFERHRLNERRRGPK